jgi:hypothetical protein
VSSRAHAPPAVYAYGVVSRALVIAALALGCKPLTPPPPVIPPPVHDPAVAKDAMHTGDIDELHDHATKTLSVMVAALDPETRAKVAHVSLDFEGMSGEVNAYATCAGYGRPLVTITDGLLDIARRLALAKATDEAYGTERVRDYMEWSSHHHGETPPVDETYSDDRRTRDRALFLFVDELAFIIGHELAHHYLGHLSCGREGGDVENVGHIALLAIPLFTQVAELDADSHAVRNTLEAARTHPWSEAGAILLLQFFRSQQTLEHWVLAFILSHPLAEIRLPAVITTADVWRATNGRLPL